MISDNIEMGSGGILGEIKGEKTSSCAISEKYPSMHTRGSGCSVWNESSHLIPPLFDIPQPNVYPHHSASSLFPSGALSGDAPVPG